MMIMTMIKVECMSKSSVCPDYSVPLQLSMKADLF